MRRLCLVALALLGALALAAPALAAPHLSRAQSREVSTLVNRFVDDLVRRRDLADGWTISGPDERGAISRKEWISGRQLPVQQLDVLNDPRTAWYATWRTRTQIGLVVSLKTGHGRNAMMYDENTVLQKVHGRWVVDSFYPDGIFRLGSGHSGSCVSSTCKVTGMADYAPSGGGGVAAAKPRIGGHWGLVVLFGLLALPLLVLAAMGVVALTRSRRARARYLASRSG
ncbi:MAG TPA: hypothetical protein VE984_04245 [Gaiellaceae bacterium]|nr:hypothetical protein [Gaiellaceae bacterium]